MYTAVENVVKWGSETLVTNGLVDQARLDAYAADLAKLEGGLIVVTSGAVALGKAEAEEAGLKIEDDQMLAGLGSASIVMAWKEAFRWQRRIAGQVLATDHQIKDFDEGGELRRALLRDVSRGIIPIFNTNDKLNHEELDKRPFKGENDGPAAHIAALVGARTLTLMTGKNGLFDEEDKTIQTVPFDLEYHKVILSMLIERQLENPAKTEYQGIVAKTKAAIEAATNGVATYIAGAGQPMKKILAGETGTYFEPNPVK